MPKLVQSDITEGGPAHHLPATAGDYAFKLAWPSPLVRGYRPQRGTGKPRLFNQMEINGRVLSSPGNMCSNGRTLGRPWEVCSVLEDARWRPLSPGEEELFTGEHNEG